MVVVHKDDEIAFGVWSEVLKFERFKANRLGADPSSLVDQFEARLGICFGMGGLSIEPNRIWFRI